MALGGSAKISAKTTTSTERIEELGCVTVAVPMNVPGLISAMDDFTAARAP